MALRSKIFETELQKTCDFPKYWMAKWAEGHKLLCRHINLKIFKKFDISKCITKIMGEHLNCDTLPPNKFFEDINF